MATSRTTYGGKDGVWHGYASAVITGEDIQEQIVIVRSEHDWNVTNVSDDDLEIDYECTLKVTKQNDAAFREEQRREDTIDFPAGTTKRYPHYLLDNEVDFTRQPGTYLVEAYSAARIFKDIGAGDRVNMGSVEVFPHVEDSFVVN